MPSTAAAEDAFAAVRRLVGAADPDRIPVGQHGLLARLDVIIRALPALAAGGGLSVTGDERARIVTYLEDALRGVRQLVWDKDAKLAELANASPAVGHDEAAWAELTAERDALAQTARNEAARAKRAEEATRELNKAAMGAPETINRLQEQVKDLQETLADSLRPAALPDNEPPDAWLVVDPVTGDSVAGRYGDGKWSLTRTVAYMLGRPVFLVKHLDTGTLEPADVDLMQHDVDRVWPCVD